MNRTIKFRAWDPENKEMISSENIRITGLGEYAVDTGKEWVIPSFDLIILQYTGLRDKHGKEIYEGDIVEDGVTKYVVCYATREAKFHLRFIYDEPIYAIHQTHKDMPLDAIFIRVIGNIYEHPELLGKEEKK